MGVIFDFILIKIIKFFYLLEENGFGGKCEWFLNIIVINLLNGLKNCEVNL